MQRNKILEKLLAVILIFTLTSVNFAFVTKTYATSIADTIFGSDSETGSKNVEFEAFFGSEDEKENSIISDVNNKELAINVKLDIKESGYLKDGKIAIVESEEGKGLNFKVNQSDELVEEIQNYEDNIYYLRQVNNSTEDVNVLIPIEFKMESFMNENDFSKDFIVRFSGIYVDDNGDENEVAKDVKLKTSWENQREVKVDTSVLKYIDYGAGVILQTLVKVDNSTENNTLPVRETELNVNVPNIDGIYPSNINVVANSTLATNGKAIDQVVFDQNNYSYNNEENKLNIKVTNEKQLVTVNEFADEYLQEADKELVQEERLSNGSGVDEYVITYTYDNVKISDESKTVTSDIEAKMTTYSGNELDGFVNITTNSNSYEYLLNGKIGEIVSLNIENETKEVSKAYSYINYDKNDRYETEMKSQTLVNISYKDIIKSLNVSDVNNYYVDKENNEIETNDIYYKQISISKDNFNSILGEEGTILVKDTEGNTLITINKDSSVDELGNIVVNFENRYSRLNFEITTPIAEGNLVITNVKAIGNVSIEKNKLVDISKISTVQNLQANYSYVENKVDVGSSISEVVLKDTSTKANLVMNRESLSTLAENKDVEFRIELNNQNDLSDVYGHSTFEFVLPEYVEKFEITNASMLYSEGLSITSVNIDDRTVKVTVDGTQEGINSGILTNGANIVLNANVKVNLFTPAKTDKIQLKVVNDKATNYENEGNSEMTISYSAPTGLVTVNSTSNYNSLGSTLTSVRQGTQEDLVDVYTEAKAATMEVIVMNNNSNTVSNVSILGRIPFKGVKDISTGNDLGTTVDTKMISSLIPDEHNQAEFTVYYSNNGEANKDLNDSSNGWTMSPETLDTVRSYLILPNDSSYIMQESEILRFTYQYEIPANLPHNEGMYGTFLAYYTNNSEVATTDEKSAPDIVGLSTGEGPEIAISVASDKNIVKENEELNIVIDVTNVGNDRADNVIATLPVPKYTTYKYITTELEGVTTSVENDNIIINVGSIEKDQVAEVVVTLVSNNVPSFIEYYRGQEGFMKREDGQYVMRTYSASEEDMNPNEEELHEITYTDEVISDLPDLKISISSKATAKDLNAEIESNKAEVQFKEAEFTIREYALDEALLSGTQDLGKQFDLGITITNCTEKEKTNTIVTKVIPEGFDYVSATINDSQDGVTYDEASRTLTCSIGNLKANGYVNISYSLKAVSIPDGNTEMSVDNKSEVKADNTETYTSNNLRLSIGKPLVTISQNTLTTDTYVKEGDAITYVFNIKNEGSVKARKVSLKDEIPEGLSINKISYITEGIAVNKKVSANDEAIVDLAINPGTETQVTVKTIASDLKGAQEKTVTNVGAITGENIDSQTTNEITHIVEARENTTTIRDESVSTDDGTVTSSSKITKTYKVSGIAWEDSNNNGMRESNETLLSGISVKLVNSETGIISQAITTDGSGNYVFSGVENGNYLVIFDYDTVRYTVTSYHKDGVASNVDSDVVTTQLEQDGKVRNGAISDVIAVSNGSVSNIDIGLVFAQTFDLSLDKTISKVSVQTANDYKKVDYDNVDLAKTEIAAKYLSGSTVYIEYSITVTNKGDVAGYAKKIVDYLPEGMTFNSSLESNANWYTGSDGNLYNEELANTQLTSGQSQTIKLVLVKQMTAENTGIVNNLAEIYQDYNIYGISDKNSIPANKAQGENDLGSADVVIAVKTGETLVYVSVIITTILLGSIVVLISFNKIVLKRKKGGV